MGKHAGKAMGTAWTTIVELKAHITKMQKVVDAAREISSTHTKISPVDGEMLDCECGLCEALAELDKEQAIDTSPKESA